MVLVFKRFQLFDENSGCCKSTNAHLVYFCLRKLIIDMDFHSLKSRTQLIFLKKICTVTLLGIFDARTLLHQSLFVIFLILKFLSNACEEIFDELRYNS